MCVCVYRVVVDVCVCVPRGVPAAGLTRVAGHLLLGGMWLVGQTLVLLLGVLRGVRGVLLLRVLRGVGLRVRAVGRVLGVLGVRAVLRVLAVLGVLVLAVLTVLGVLVVLGVLLVVLVVLVGAVRPLLGEVLCVGRAVARVALGGVGQGQLARAVGVVVGVAVGVVVGDRKSTRLNSSH